MNAASQTSGRSLTDFEWKIVEIARKDGPRSIRPDGPRARFVRNFFGLPIARGLANERAEALRRFCVSAWYRDRIGAGEVRPLIAAGYSTADAARILAHVSGYRGFTPPMQEGALG